MRKLKIDGRTFAEIFVEQGASRRQARLDEAALTSLIAELGDEIQDEQKFPQWSDVFDRLVEKGLLERSDEGYKLSEKGREEGRRQARANGLVGKREFS